MDDTVKLPLTSLKQLGSKHIRTINSFKIGKPSELRFDVPEDGMPSIDDWITTFTSILLDGLDLQREPLDVSVRASYLSQTSPKTCWPKFVSNF